MRVMLLDRHGASVQSKLAGRGEFANVSGRSPAMLHHALTGCLTAAILFHFDFFQPPTPALLIHNLFVFHGLLPYDRTDSGCYGFSDGTAAVGCPGVHASLRLQSCRRQK